LICSPVHSDITVYFVAQMKTLGCFRKVTRVPG